MGVNYIVDCERMRYPNSGLFKFCEYLGLSLLEEKELNEEIHFYTPMQKLDFFGTNAHYLKQSYLHKILFPRLPSNSIWHSTYQDSEYFPYDNKIPIIMTVHDINFMHSNEKSSFKKKYLLKRLQRKIDRANHVVFISDFVKNDLSKYINIQAKNTSIIYNGCNVNPEILSTAPLLKPSKEFLFTISLISPKKNIHVLPALLSKNNYMLVIAGNNNDKAYVEVILREARKFKVEDRIIFTGPISENDKYWYYKNCKAFLFPSLAEGFGMPVVEAMAFGKPVFLSSKTSLPEIGADVAFYFSSFESTEMQKVFESCMDYYNKHQLVDAIKANANRFNWAKTAKAYLNIYRSLY